MIGAASQTANLPHPADHWTGWWSAGGPSAASALASTFTRALLFHHVTFAPQAEDPILQPQFRRPPAAGGMPSLAATHGGQRQGAGE